MFEESVEVAGEVALQAAVCFASCFGRCGARLRKALEALRRCAQRDAGRVVTIRAFADGTSREWGEDLLSRQKVLGVYELQDWRKAGMRRATEPAPSKVNAQLFELALKTPAVGSERMFFCECGGRACWEMVALTVEAYTAIRHRGGAILATGHRTS